MSLTAEVHQDPPPLDVDPWEDVSDISVQLSAEPLLIFGFGFVPVSDVPLDNPHAGIYRLLIHGRDRDLVYGRGSGSEGRDEQHLIQL
jgi:hypothetical protein